MSARYDGAFYAGQQSGPKQSTAAAVPRILDALKPASFVEIGSRRREEPGEPIRVVHPEFWEMSLAHFSSGQYLSMFSRRERILAELKKVRVELGAARRRALRHVRLGRNAEGLGARTG